MNLIEKLREQTKPFHERLDQMEKMKLITSDDVEMADYVSYLHSFYPIYAVIEKDIYERSQPIIDGIEKNQRKDNLINDLNFVDNSVEYAEEIAAEINLAGYEVLGALYVMEGSRLGGKFIGSHLKKKLGLTDEALMFLLTPGAVKWSQIINEINQQPEENHSAVISGAKKTFEFFYDRLYEFYMAIK